MKKKNAGGRYTALYDGSCHLCSGAVARLRARDREGVLDFVSFRSPGVEERFPDLSPEALEESLHLVGPDGETWEGARAVEEILRILPGWGWLTWAFRVPLVRPLARATYRFVARNRYRVSCGSHCS